MIKGWVYILTNSAMSGLVKVGYSTKDPALRVLELDGTGVPHRFEVAYEVLVMQPREVEQATHKVLKDQGKHESKEFFRTDVLTAIDAIKIVIEDQNKLILLESATEYLNVNSQPKIDFAIKRDFVCELSKMRSSESDIVAHYLMKASIFSAYDFALASIEQVSSAFKSRRDFLSQALNEREGLRLRLKK